MLACAESALLAATQPTTATAAQAALEVARRAAAEYQPGHRMRDLHEKQIAGLRQIELCCRSEALRAAVHAAMGVKSAEYEKSVAHCRFQEVWASLKGHDQRVADAAHQEIAPHEAAWMQAWGEVKNAAAAVLNAPAEGPHDFIDRARAYLFLVGDFVIDGEPTSSLEDDTIDALRSFQLEIERQIHERPDSEAFHDAEIAYRNHDRDLNQTGEEVDRLAECIGRGGLVEAHVLKAADRRHEKLVNERHAVADRLLAEEPTDLAGLLTFMEVIFDRGFQIDTGSYAARAQRIAEGPVTCEAMQTYEGQRRALALIAKHVATLRERELPSDWRALMAPGGGMRGMHPNAADAIMTAYQTHQLDPATITNVQLSGAPERDLPVLTFQDGPSKFWNVGPRAAFEWKPVK